MQQRSSAHRSSRHWLWLGMVIAVLAIILVLFMRAAAGQTERGIELTPAAGLPAPPPIDQPPGSPE